MNDAFIADPSADNPLIPGENREQDEDENHLNLGFVEDPDDEKKVYKAELYFLSIITLFCVSGLGLGTRVRRELILGFLGKPTVRVRVANGVSKSAGTADLRNGVMQP